jgi:ankyrin repeat protein
MRFDDRDNFVYLLKRGIKVTNQDKNGNNAIHYAV